MISFLNFINESSMGKSKVSVYKKDETEKNVGYWYNVLQQILDMKKVRAEIPSLSNEILDMKKDAVKSFFETPLTKIKNGLKLLKKDEDGNYVLPSFTNTFGKQTLDAETVEKKIPQCIAAFEEFKKMYEKYEAVATDILTVVSVGDTEEVAAKKIAKLTNNLRYFSISKNAYGAKVFDPYDEEDIMKLIRDAKAKRPSRYVLFVSGMPFDLNVHFANGKVSKVYL